MDCGELRKQFEQKWLEDKRRWEEEKRELKELLEKKDEEITKLKRELTEQGNQIREQCRRELEALRADLEGMRQAHRRCEQTLLQTQNQLEHTQKRLETLSQPPLGEGFFRYLRKHIELWDQTLIEEISQLHRENLESWFKETWAEREKALSQVLSAEVVDWRRVRTGLVLEWALLAWLEGMCDG
ncbi:DUF713 domain-containing protein [Thermus brockianus]|uniref:Chromosome partition protein Smc n=1 Tax=Thermus brockianus TaxID=56956 RepID=A0ABN6NKW3_THEBO|nr:DUF713 domain-containing protein [Thermus brockianus]BDG17707.1 hypothetical protein TbrSNM41_24410 [Thermus brockianus]